MTLLHPEPIPDSADLGSLLAPLKRDSKTAPVEAPLYLSYWPEVWQRFCQNRVALFSLYFLLGLLLFALLGPLLSTHTYYETHLSLKNHSPSWQFWFGTDDLGRDQLVRLAYGARISLFIGISAALIDVSIGILWGGIAAWVGGKTDLLLMRIADILYSLPQLLVVIMVMVVLGTGLSTILIALTITGWIGMSRIVRGQLMQLKRQDYIQAAISLGASKKRILFKHLIPNAIGPIIATMTITIPVAIFSEAFLSFLGLGVPAPMASWGTMASDGLPAMRFYPWRLLFPALFISATMLALNVVGDALRDAVDPKLRGAP